MKKNQKQNKGRNEPWGQIRLGGFRAEFPQPRLPGLIGSDRNLSSKNSVYPTVNLDVPITPTKASLVAGAVAASIALDTTVMSLFGKLGAAFREYAIVGARLEIRPNNFAVTAGIAKAYLDETSSAVPTASDAKDRPCVDMLCAPIFQPGGYHVMWTPRDLLDLDYVSTGTNFTPVYLKIFASVADTFTQATTTGDFIVTGAIALTFRGYV